MVMPVMVVVPVVVAMMMVMMLVMTMAAPAVAVLMIGGRATVGLRDVRRRDRHVARRREGFVGRSRRVADAAQAGRGPENCRGQNNGKHRTTM
jgi:hypothetical protein